MEQITLTVQDGTKMEAYASRPKAKSKMGIIIFQEAFGVNSHIKDMTKHFADEGYIAIAPELFHRTAPPGFTAGYDQFNSVMDHFTAITSEGLIQDSQACFNWLKENGAESIAVIGHCLGGRVSFVVNSALDVKCAVSYYGGRIATMNLDLAAKQKSPLLFFWGNLDQHIPNDQIQSINAALTENKKKFTCVQFSDADHGFFCDERPSYNPQAARESWAMTLQFLKENM